ncbi:MAG: AAA family ATPase, partial [Bdellovibrionales bacterium]
MGQDQDDSKTDMGVLLPGSRVAVFSTDQETLDAAASLAEDWRFARVGLETHKGGVDDAIDVYRAHESPDLLIVQTDTVDDDFSKKLEDLAAQCDEGTAAIVIGPVNDVYLYRRMIDMGISDYLVRPVEPTVLADVIARALVDRLGVSDSQLVAVIGAKGGVGASTIAQGLACCAADLAQQKTVLLDICGGRSTLNVGLGFEPTTTLAEAVRVAEKRDDEALKRMLHAVSDKLSVLASGGDMMLERVISPAQIEALIDVFMAAYPVVVVDLSQAEPELARAVLVRANRIIVTATPGLPALRQSRALIHEIKTARGNQDGGIDFVINMQGLAGPHEIAKKDIETAM